MLHLGTKKQKFQISQQNITPNMLYTTDYHKMKESERLKNKGIGKKIKMGIIRKQGL